MEKLVYKFGIKSNEGSSKMKDLLGGKGANLAEMCHLGIAVPPGFTITTEVCKAYYAGNKILPKNLTTQVESALKEIEGFLGRNFGDAKNPLLVSVRSGAKLSMPGMMDTILNLGLNDETVLGLASASNNPSFAYDSYRRFIQMYSNVVLNLDPYLFEEVIEWKKRDTKAINDTDLSTEDLIDIIANFKEIVKNETGNDFPQDVQVQLWSAINAVFDSWMCNRAITYRKLNNIDSNLGTAVNIQSMVFGNTGNESATGVLFSRNPTNGDNNIYGEYLINAQGEDVVAGTRTPQNVSILGKEQTKSDLPSMEETMPKLYQDLQATCKKLEKHYKDMQDVEFTIENGKLWILQTRSGKRTAKADIVIAVDLVKEGVISKEDAIARIDINNIDKLLHPTIDEQVKYNVIAKGLPASPGAAMGKVVFSSEKAEELALQHKVILVRVETSPEDINGMHAAQGILTSRGGMTSHAAVVARGMGKPCVCGAKDLNIDYKNNSFTTNGVTVKEGDIISLNGNAGEVILGEVTMTKPELFEEFNQIITWSNQIRNLKIRTNAETKTDSETARNFGAEGIGLCRTEHMFFEADRINSMREMILSTDLKQRRQALNKLLPMQTKDFIDIFNVMHGLPVTIRFLDPPLHEFLPHNEQDMKELAKAMSLSFEQVKSRSNQLKEHNPMLGHRGCRLGITYPEIYEMQARAVFEAMVAVNNENLGSAIAEIMIPLIFNVEEFNIMKKIVDDVAQEIEKKHNVSLKYEVGTMIELPKAALKAGNIAASAGFFSFGTNDLTQTALGISRDDAAIFLNEYKEKGVIKTDPFASIDQDGVGELLTIAIERGRRTKPNLKIGICGEHGGDPASIKFFHDIGLDYVSCSPFRVPVAIIAAAKAKLGK
ncbi:MAG: pyruvate, phosphate dikinase [Rickettsiales bacterium]|jgi:pyruvate,orthophosphate dikinase|nr:pyruvate, phosphate dikinase [Rickettsiales bacterium]